MLRLFRAWPHREGLHDSMSYLYMLREIVKIEGDAADADGYVPEKARVRTMLYEKVGDGKHAVLHYALSDPEARELVMRKRVLVMDEMI